MKKQIAGLALTLVLLLTGYGFAKDSQAVKADVLVKSGESWNGDPLPLYPKGTPEVTIMRITIPAGAVLPMHNHPVINAGVLLSGELTVTTDKNQVLRLKAGDPIVEVVGTWHWGKNEGAGPAEIIVFYAGEKDVPVTVKK